MFLGHYAVGFAIKAAAPRASLGTQFAAVQTLDLLWPMLVLTGIEQLRIDPFNTAVTPLDFVHYPWSHSLAMAVAWGVLFAAAYRWRCQDGRMAAWLGVAVFSHWVLDWVSHRPDMPLAPWSDVKVGLGLWNSVSATVAVELGMFAAGLSWYLVRTRATSRKGTLALAGLVVVLLGISIGNLLAPPPPSANAVAVSALGLWLFVLWGWWADRNRAGKA